MIRALDIAANQVWAIAPDALRQLLAIANREGDLEALATREGELLKGTTGVEARGDIAVIDVNGPIFRYANLFTRVSGATSTEILATDFQKALDSPAIRAIVLNIDSPGGMVAGTHEFAETIYAARRKKDVFAYIGGDGMSAAYWFASAAKWIVADATAEVGSIGVIATVIDDSDRQAKDGVRKIQIVSSQSPNKRRPDVTTDEGRATIQRRVDDLADVFIGAVARNRGTTAKRVREEFGAGGIFVGERALEAGLVDQLGSLEGVLASLMKGGNGPAYQQLLGRKRA